MKSHIQEERVENMRKILLLGVEASEAFEDSEDHEVWEEMQAIEIALFRN